MENTSNQNSFIINVTEDGIEINNQPFQLPLNFSDLKEQFGNQYEQWKETDTNIIYMWHDLGFKIFVPKNEDDSITLAIKTADIDEAFLPKNKFSGVLKFKNKNYTDFFSITETDRGFKDLEIENIRISALLSEDELKNIEEVSIWEKVENKKVKIKSDKFKTNKVAGEAIIFADFNFKLAVIEELMYTKELIQPKFDIFEFADTYQERDIDVEEEGTNPILEAITYFKNLTIDKTLAEHLTQIYQDGGNDIYMNITPYWDGEDDSFTIQNYEDIQHFPNLKKMTLFSNDSKVYEELKSKGIEAQPL